MPVNAPQPHRPGKPAGAAPRPKPAPKSIPKAAAPPADSFLGWLGRQVGHVKKAVQTDVTKPGKVIKSSKPKQPTAASPSAPKPAANPAPKPSRPSPGPAPANPAVPPGVSAASNVPPSMVVYRNDKIEEAEMPDRPGVKLRRTIIDEVIVEKSE